MTIQLRIYLISLKEIKDILISHATWDDYNAMIRIFKIYSFKFNDELNQIGLTNHTVSFSSYPGCISSTDDYYIVNQDLFITETTISSMVHKIIKIINNI